MSIHAVPFLLQLASGMEVFLINFTLYYRLLFLQTSCLEVVDQPRTKCKPIKKNFWNQKIIVCRYWLHKTDKFKQDSLLQYHLLVKKSSHLISWNNKNMNNVKNFRNILKF